MPLLLFLTLRLAILEKQTPFGKIYSTESHFKLHYFVTQLEHGTGRLGSLMAHYL